MTGPRAVRPIYPAMQAWDVTADNLADVAKWCGGHTDVYTATPSGRGGPSISVPGPEYYPTGSTTQSRYLTFASPGDVVWTSADIDYYVGMPRRMFDASYRDEAPA